MARAVDVINGNDQMRGFDMTTGAHLTKAHPSLANGCRSCWPTSAECARARAKSCSTESS